MSCTLRLSICSLLYVVFAPLTADASLTFYGTRAAFETANPGLVSEDFEEANLLSGQITAIANPLNALTNNGVFSSGDIVTGLNIVASGGTPGAEIAVARDFNGAPSAVVYANTFVESLNVEFGAGTRAVGLDSFSQSFDSTVVAEIFGAGGSLGTFDISALTGGTFFGVSSDSDDIVRINFNSLTNQAEGIDNVSFGPAGGGVVPEPATFAMWGFGALALGLVRRRKHSRHA